MVGRVVVDGTKVAGNASLSANRTYGYLEGEVRRMLREAEETDAAEDGRYGEGLRGDELPEELAKRESRLAKLRQAKEEMERLARERSAQKAAEMEVRRQEEAVCGKKKRGRKPKAPDPRPDPEVKVNLTDPESRIMRTRTRYIQGYNAQVVVSEDQIIVAAEVTQDQNAVNQLHPMVERAKEELERAGVRKRVKAVVGDAGYFSEDNVKKAAPNGPELVIAPGKRIEVERAWVEGPPPRGRIPKGTTERERMERKLSTKRGQGLYKLRAKTVEPVLGQVKDGRGCDRFLRRGVWAVRSEWRLMCATHNLTEAVAQRESVRERLPKGDGAAEGAGLGVLRGETSPFVRERTTTEASSGVLGRGGTRARLRLPP
jgi:hypothetical protein